MLGVLEIVLRHHNIAGRLRVTRQLQVFLGDMLGGAADLDVRVRSIRKSEVNGLGPLRLLRPRIRLLFWPGLIYSP